jgi:aldehyde:ferredoxin oxidoreductase
LIRQGWGGRKADTLLPYLHEEPLQGVFFNRESTVPAKNGKTASLKGAVVDKTEFETMKDEYYALRGWDVSIGLQTRAKMDELDLSDIANGLDAVGLLR